MATSNTITPAEVYSRAIDEKYRQLSKTAFLETDSILVHPQGAGTIKIPKINVNLPIYHGTSEEVLKIGAGHIEGTSFPTGELGTHAVISGHRGLPSSKLFTDLDELKVGDQFTLSILDRELTYEIDQIEVVEPNDVDSLKIEKDKNYVTLVTCTPYGINSHRLLIRGVGVWKN